MADGYLIKDFYFDELKKKIAEILQKNPANFARVETGGHGLQLHFDAALNENSHRSISFPSPQRLDDKWA